MALTCTRMVLFGASGDLAGRYLLPALASLHAAGKLPADFALIGAARQPWTTEQFRRHAAERLAEHAKAVPAAAREAVVRGARYVTADLSAADSVQRALREASEDGRAVAAYLALPPALYRTTIEALCAAGLPEGSRLAVEKPFGTDLDGARSLNALLARFAGRAGEQAVYRVDHALGMVTAQNLLAMRMLNPALASLWNGRYVERLEVRWEETLAMEGRGAFYDQTGALRDVLQNHAMQVLCLAAMEPPDTMHERALRDRKVELLRAVRSPARDVTAWSCRARYTAGTIPAADGQPARPLPAYVDEPGVDAARRTETFAQVALEIDTPRWHGTQVVLRGGKALARTRKEVVMRFRRPEQVAFGFAPGELAGAVLRIGIDGPEDVAVCLHGYAPDAPEHPTTVTLTGPPPPSELPVYGRVLHDLLSGGSALSIRGDLAEEAWRVVMPVLDAWAEDRVPLLEYPAGSNGP